MEVCSTVCSSVSGSTSMSLYGASPIFVPRGLSPSYPVFSSHQTPTFEFVQLSFNLICSLPQKLSSIKHYRVEIRVVSY